MGKDKEILVRNILFQGNCACAQGYTVWGTSEATHCRENRLYCNDPDKSLSKHTNTVIYPGCGIVSIIATMHYLKYSIFNQKKKNLWGAKTQEIVTINKKKIQATETVFEGHMSDKLRL